jgi:hypothetical protein
MVRCGIEMSRSFEQLELALGRHFFCFGQQRRFFLFAHGLESFGGFKCLLQDFLAVNARDHH